MSGLKSRTDQGDGEPGSGPQARCHLIGAVEDLAWEDIYICIIERALFTAKRLFRSILFQD